MAQAISTGTFGVAKWVVSPDPTQGTHTTIQSAIDSATAGETVFIRDGVYTEDLVLSQGINLYALNGDSSSLNSKVIGNIQGSYSGSVAISGLEIQTNSNPCITLSGSNPTVLIVSNCLINALNNSAISSNNSSAALFIEESFVSQSSNNQIFSITSVGGVDITNSSIIGGTTVNTIVAGAINFFNSKVQVLSISCSGTGSVNIYNSFWDNASNLNILTFSGNSSSTIGQSILYSGNVSAFSIGSGCSVRISSSSINSSATNVITGLGTLVYTGLSFPGSSSNINATTQTLNTFGPSISTAPAASSLSTLSLGSAYQNTLGYDVLLTVYINITINAAGNITCGVGPTSTPTAQTLVTGVTVLGYFPISVYLPSNYYALITATGLTASIVGQQVTPV